ncbi:TetR/AcrR family transcriptional regulator [uncultured Parasutterella sp.]|uniref:TetR/AcrR family transcriptional regulator n=1 Tax=uncultured Parasutterella sp. TaxID=1263098 RepID=UPI00259A3011|nr:TetR/AcrR family transcriptional regulator [uncultured Parasutterella sp.]
MGSPLNLTRQDEKRLKILAAAEETFLEKGFHAASMSDIARKAGISTPHLYNFYENKAAIALSVQEKMAEATFTLLTGAMNSEPEEQEKFIKHLLDPRRASLTLTVMTGAGGNPVVMELVGEEGEKVMTHLGARYDSKEDDEDRLFRLEVSMRLFLGISIGSVFCGIVEGGKLRNILMEINRWLVDNKSETNCLNGEEKTNAV